MDCVRWQPEREVRPAAWGDKLRFHVLINSVFLELDELNRMELKAFSRILGDTVMAFELAQAMGDEADRPASVEVLRAVERAVADVVRGQPVLPTGQARTSLGYSRSWRKAA